VTYDLFSEQPRVESRGTAPAMLPPFVRIVREPSYVARIIHPLAALEEGEVFWILHLDSQSNCRGITEVTRGLLNSSLVHPREVFRMAVAWGDAGIILAHNHPSGDPTPSAEDRAATKQIVSAGRLLDIPVYDHIVVAGDRFVSFATAGLL
jgi:DNA repair protein RadC